MVLKSELSMRQYASQRINVLGNLTYRKAVAFMIIQQEMGLKTANLHSLRREIRKYIGGEKSVQRKYIEVLTEYEFLRKHKGMFILDFSKVPNDPEIRDIYLQSLYLKRRARDYYRLMKREHETLSKKSCEGESLDGYFDARSGGALENVSLSQKLEERREQGSTDRSYIKEKKEEEPERERHFIDDKVGKI